MTGPEEDRHVPPEERRMLVLEFINEHDMPLPPLAIYAGLVRQYRITFAYRTIQNILKELVEEGSLIRVDTKKLREGDIEPLGDTESRRRAYYFITTEGKERVGDA